MRTTRTLPVLVLMFVLAMAAGVVAGILAARLPAAHSAATDSTDPAGTADAAPPLDELHLGPDQREAMRRIWEGVRDQARDYLGDAQAAQKERDQRVIGLLKGEQIERYKQIVGEYEEKVAQLSRKREAAFQEAVARTKQVLNDSQRRTYERIIKDRLGQRPEFIPSAGQPASAPATTQSSP